MKSKLTQAKYKAVADAGEYLWCVVANVSGGDWTKQSKYWQEAAINARDQYFKAISQ